MAEDRHSLKIMQMEATWTEQFLPKSNHGVMQNGYGVLYIVHTVAHISDYTLHSLKQISPSSAETSPEIALEALKLAM